MKVENLIDYDLFTYLIIGAIIISIFSVFYLAINIYGSRRKKINRFKTIITVIFFLISLSLVFYYYRPVNLKFKEPISQDYDIFVYKSQPNSTGGITEDRYKLTSEEYLKIINILGNTSLSRQIIDWNKSNHDVIQYDVVIVPIIRDYKGVYLNEIRLYIDVKHEYKSFIIATHDGRKQTYNIKDISAIESLITELEK